MVSAWTFRVARRASILLLCAILGACGGGGGGGSSQGTIVEPPVSPTGLSGSAGNGVAMLQWQAVSGATGYAVERATSSGGPYTLLTTTSATSYTDTAVANGTSYYYAVYALNGVGKSALSTQVSVTPDAAVSISTTSLPAATVGVPYSATLVASGGDSPYHWSLGAGNTLPAGLALSGNTFSGTPSSAVTGAQITVTVTDSASPAASASQTLTLTVGVSLVSIRVTVPSVSVGESQSEQLVATADYSDGSSSDITSRATWSSDAAAVLRVDGAPSNGLATGLGVGIAGVTASLGGVSSPKATIHVVAQMPLEVFGPAGTTGDIHISLPSIANITRLYIQCHACGYKANTLDADPSMNKASLTLPGGRVVRLKYYSGGRLVGNRSGGFAASGTPDVRDPSVTLMEPELSYGGIGGGFRTVRMYVNLQPGDLVVGDNRFRFEHTNPDKTSIGFRVVDFNLVMTDGFSALVHPLSTDDPSQWQPPSTNPADIAAGRALWTTGNILNDPYYSNFPKINNTAATRIQASCSDCHAADGSDLHYFNYSNSSIVKRAVFHGLTPEQGSWIASYIRQLPVHASPYARPWNPPYQPGPGIDARAVDDWAAGAGVGAVLNNDSDMKPFLFPNGTSQAAVDAVVNRFGTLNIRQLPVAIQLPDWNSWLPRVHPKDLFNIQSPIVRSRYGYGLHLKAGTTNPDTGMLYSEYAYQTLKALRGDQINAGVDDFLREIFDWVSSGASCYSQTADSGPSFRANDSDIIRDGLTLGPKIDPAACTDFAGTAAGEEAKRGLAAWTSVKQWEIIHGNRLETASQSAPAITVPHQPPVPMHAGYPLSPSVTLKPAEQFGWGQKLNAGGVFFRAPHFLGYTSEFMHDQDPLTGRYETTTWYHLEMVLNPGYRTSQPSHFPYTLLYITGTGADQKLANPASPRYESFRYWASIIKMRQLQTNGYYGNEVGLDLRTAQPFFYYSDAQGNTAVPAGVDSSGSVPVLWKALVRSALWDLVADASNASETDWVNANQNSVVQTADATLFPASGFTQCPGCFPGPGKVGGSGAPFRSPGAIQGTNTLRLLTHLSGDVQVDTATIDHLIDWCDVMWPQAQSAPGASTTLFDAYR